MACMRGLFQQEEKGALPTIVDPEPCYGCGQCVAICRQGAISHSDYPEGMVTPIQSEMLPSYDQILELIRSRRSKRLFKDQIVEKDAIGKIVEAARFAPSGHNEQTTEFVVVRDKDIIREVAVLTSRYLDGLDPSGGTRPGSFLRRRRRGLLCRRQCHPGASQRGPGNRSHGPWLLLCGLHRHRR